MRLDARKKRKIVRIGKELLVHSVLIIGACVVLFPFFWVFCTAFKGSTEVLSWPPRILPRNPIMGNFIEVFRKWPFHGFIFNSVLISSIATLSVLVTSTLSGYVFAKIRFFGRNHLFFLLIATSMIPFQAYALSLYLFINKLRWLNTYQGLVFPLLIMSYAIFFMRQSISSIPNALIDAARLDGCSEFSIYYRIILPLSISAQAAVAIWAFTAAWNFFFWFLLITNKTAMYTAELGLAFFQQRFFIQYGLISAGSAVCMLPLLIVFVVFQRRIIEGMTLSGLKF